MDRVARRVDLVVGRRVDALGEVVGVRAEGRVGAVVDALGGPGHGSGRSLPRGAAAAPHDVAARATAAAAGAAFSRRRRRLLLLGRAGIPRLRCMIRDDLLLLTM